MVKISLKNNTNNFTNKFNTIDKFNKLYKEGDDIYTKTELKIDNIFQLSGCFSSLCSLELEDRTTVILSNSKSKYKEKASGYFLFIVSKVEEKNADGFVCVLMKHIKNYVNILNKLDEITKIGTDNQINKFGLESSKTNVHYLLFDKLKNKDIDMVHVSKTIDFYIIPLLALMKYKAYIKIPLIDDNIGYFIIEKYKKYK
jgi:hypothetical protein